RAEQAEAEEKNKASEERAAKTAPQVRVAPTLSAAAATPAAAGEKVAPTLNEDEPLHERLNVDRTAHDLLAETADVRRKTEVAELGRSAVAARRQRQEEDDRRTAGALRHRRQRRATRAFGLGLVGVPALIVAGLQFVPMNGYLPDAQKALSERLNQPVTISTLRYVLLPSPRLVLEGVRVGSAQGIRVDRVDAHAWPMTIAAEPKVFSEVEATGVSIDPGMLGAIPSWTGGRSATAVHVSRLKLKDVKLSMRESEIAGLNGAVTFAANGTVQQAVLANDKVKIEITPQQSGVRVLLNAHDWRPPFGPPVAFSHLTVDGIADRQQFGTTELSARIGGGSLTGTLAARWEGPMTVGGEFKLQGAKIDEVVPLVVPDFRMKGTLGASGRYAMQADSATGVPGKPLVEASFTITRGELPSFDIARAIQSGNAGRGGRTPFDELKGTVHVNAGQYRYRNLQLSSGPLSARGNVDIASGGQISGHIEAAMEARGSTVARSAFGLAGTAKDAQLVR
ncbi:MAG TPA: hypothetical protein VGP15_06990, partial [Burkholderiales bacterium]|nr:hypothetical protein [Burkholderiales bacterium]